MNQDVDHALDTIGPRLKRLRLRRDLTLAELSERTGISVSTLSRCRRVDHPPTHH